MAHLLQVKWKHALPAPIGYPFAVPQVRALDVLELGVPVTFFVGENGSGKSTVLEGIAAAAELPAMGATQVQTDDTLAGARLLGSALRLVWTARSRKGFFLRAEDFFGRLRWLARDDARRVREASEVAAGVRAQDAATVHDHARHPDEREAAKYVARYDDRSHGESFMDLFAHRVRSGGLYLLDEPEAPLSVRHQIALVNLLVSASKVGAQFVIATHSPILLACPGARIYSFDHTPIRSVRYDELEQIRVMREFLTDPGRFVEG